MPENVVINFEASLEGFEPLIKALKEVGALTEKQAQEFLNLEKKQQEQLSKTTEQVKAQNSELGKLVNNLKNAGEGVAGGALKQSFAGLEGAMKRMAAIPIVKQLQELKKAGKENTDEFKKLAAQLLAADKAFNGTAASVEQVEVKTKKLTTQLREMRDRLAQLPEGSAEFQKLAIEAAKLEDQIGDVNERVRVMASDTFAFDAMVDGIRGVTAAFTIAQSASALLGDENEDLQKALLKVQAATGLLVGVQEISNQLKGQGAAKLAILSAAQKAYGFVVGTSTGALKAFRIALAATGIGLLVIAVGTLVANWDKLKKAVDENSEGFQNFKKIIAFVSPPIYLLIKAFEALNKNFDKIKETVAGLGSVVALVFSKIGDAASFILKGQFGKLKETFANFGSELQLAFEQGRQKEIDKQAEITLKKQLEAENKKNERLINVLEAQGRDTFEIRKKILQNELKFLEKGTEEYLDKLNELDVLVAQRQRKIREGLESFENIDVGIDFKTKDDILKPEQEITIPVKFDVPEEVFRDEEIALDKINEKFEEQKKIREEQLELEKKIREELEAAAIESAQVIADTIFEINATARQAELDEDLSRLEQQKEAELANKNLTENQRFAIEEKFRRKEAKIKEEAFKKDKQARIVQAIINTALGIVQSLANTTLPFPASLAGPIAIGIAGAASIAAIAAQPVPKFRTGTKDAPGGMALVGEGGPELVHLPKGSKVITHPETKNFLNGVNVADIISKYNLPQVAQIKATGTDGRRDFSFDYERLGKELSKYRSQTNVSLDENGLKIFVQKGIDEREYTNKKYRSS